MRVAFQGEIGAFSQEALRAYFIGREIAHVPLPTFEAVFQAVGDGSADRAVLPIENSLFGSVHANYDLLRQHDLKIIGEVKLRVVHNLLALPGETLSSIRHVYSHPQALGQCQDFLRRQLPQAEAIAAYDTAGSAKVIAEQRQAHTAAIASRQAAAVYGLQILAEGIESNHQNYTRFLVLAREEDPEPGNGERGMMKTSVVYAMRENVPGALFKSLAAFAMRDLDLLKIESRPLVGSPWAYLFYLDFSGSLNDHAVQRALEHLSEMTAYLKVLGSYPAGQVVG